MRALTRFLRQLLSAAWRGAAVAVACYLGALFMAGNGGTSPLPLPVALDRLDPALLGRVALSGALALMALVAVLRPIPAGPCRAIIGGLIMGAAAVVVVHQSSLFVLHQAFRLVPERGFLFAPLPLWGGLPALYALMLAGAGLGAMLSLALRLVWALPDLLTGFLCGAFLFTLLSGSLPRVPGFEAPWWMWLAINGGWGWGTAFLMRPLALRGAEDAHRERENPQHAIT
ncbi:hypothetical protein [Pseudoroseomonas cervicalis]|uniref:hypothetical protein n=1 Tax=Teichococcus cervicalis TaxID=204525 RepID=UPI0027845382|nr:hypothetical protein [Pseudoroseomonas cervicalis]MDQ1081234.1 hypothetical protein [Pseudoroseomonas cervicalis]